MKKFILIVLMSLMLVGCGIGPYGSDGSESAARPVGFPTNIPTSQEVTWEWIKTESGYYITEIVDRRYGVVCFSYGGGLDCLPISETLLGE